MQTFQLGGGDGVLPQQHSVTARRDGYADGRTVLRVLGDLLPGIGIMPGFPSSAPGTQTLRAP